MQQVAPLDRAVGRRAARSVRRGPDGEVAIDDRRLAEPRRSRRSGRSGRRRARSCPARRAPGRRPCPASDARRHRRQEGDLVRVLGPAQRADDRVEVESSSACGETLDQARRDARHLDPDAAARAGLSGSPERVRTTWALRCGAECWPSYQTGATTSSTWDRSRNGRTLPSATSVARSGSSRSMAALSLPRNSNGRWRVVREVDQVRGVGHDQQVARGGQGVPQPLATLAAAFGGEHDEASPCSPQRHEGHRGTQNEENHRFLTRTRRTLFSLCPSPCPPCLCGESGLPNQSSAA